MITCHIDIEIIRDAEIEFKKDSKRNSREFIDFLGKDCELAVYGLQLNIDNELAEKDLEIINFYIEGRGEISQVITNAEHLGLNHYHKNRNNPC